jgi:hypothetical protein
MSYINDQTAWPYQGGDWVDRNFTSYAKKVADTGAIELGYNDTLGKIDADTESAQRAIQAAKLRQQLKLQKMEDSGRRMDWYWGLTDYENQSYQSRITGDMDTWSRIAGSAYERWNQNKYDPSKDINTNGWNPSWDNAPREDTSGSNEDYSWGGW